MPTADEFVSHVQDALKHLYDPDYEPGEQLSLQEPGDVSD